MKKNDSYSRVLATLAVEARRGRRRLLGRPPAGRGAAAGGKIRAAAKPL